MQMQSIYDLILNLYTAINFALDHYSLNLTHLGQKNILAGSKISGSSSGSQTFLVVPLLWRKKIVCPWPAPQK